MVLSSLLLSAGQQRPLWREVGVGLVAVDTLVHNFLLRTGILRRLGADHPYGVRCYRTGGCADILTRFAASIDARQFNPAFPQTFPRFVQNAVWRYCAVKWPGHLQRQSHRRYARCDNRHCQLFRTLRSRRFARLNAGKSHEFHDLKLLTEGAPIRKGHASRHESRDPVAAPSFGEQ